MKCTKKRDEDIPFGRRTFFGEMELLHPNIAGDSSGITLARHEEMHYGVYLIRGDWGRFFSAQVILVVADFTQQHHSWLEWGCTQNAGEYLSPSLSGYIAQPGTHDDDLSIYALYSPICYFHPELPADPTGIILTCNDAGCFGICIVGSIVFPPTFYRAEDIIKIAEFLAKNRSWLERGVRLNAEQSLNEVTENIYLSLQYHASANAEGEAGVPDGTKITILLWTSDSYANYGIPTEEQEITGPFRWRPYPHQYWEQVAALRQE